MSFGRNEKIFGRFFLIDPEAAPIQERFKVRSKPVEGSTEPFNFLSQAGQLVRRLVFGGRHLYVLFMDDMVLILIKLYHLGNHAFQLVAFSMRVRSCRASI